MKISSTTFLEIKFQTLWARFMRLQIQPFVPSNQTYASPGGRPYSQHLEVLQALYQETVYWFSPEKSQIALPGDGKWWPQQPYQFRGCLPWRKKQLGLKRWGDPQSFRNTHRKPPPSENNKQRKLSVLQVQKIKACDYNSGSRWFNIYFWGEENFVLIAKSDTSFHVFWKSTFTF